MVVSFFVQTSIFGPAGSGFALALVSWMLVFGCWFLGFLFYQLHGWRLCFPGSFFFFLCTSLCHHTFLAFCLSVLSSYIPV